jgi:hypothetical protein
MEGLIGLEKRAILGAALKTLGGAASLVSGAGNVAMKAGQFVGGTTLKAAKFLNSAKPMGLKGAAAWTLGPAALVKSLEGGGAPSAANIARFGEQKAQKIANVISTP